MIRPPVPGMATVVPFSKKPVELNPGLIWKSIIYQARNLLGISRQLTAVDWLWTSCEGKQVFYDAHSRLPTPSFNRNHEETGEKNQQDLDPFEGPF